MITVQCDEYWLLKLLVYIYIYIYILFYFFYLALNEVALFLLSSQPMTCLSVEICLSGKKRKSVKNTEKQRITICINIIICTNEHYFNCFVIIKVTEIIMLFRILVSVLVGGVDVLVHSELTFMMNYDFIQYVNSIRLLWKKLQ